MFLMIDRKFIDFIPQTEWTSFQYIVIIVTITQLYLVHFLIVCLLQTNIIFCIIAILWCSPDEAFIYRSKEYRTTLNCNLVTASIILGYELCSLLKDTVLSVKVRTPIKVLLEGFSYSFTSIYNSKIVNQICHKLYIM